MTKQNKVRLERIIAIGKGRTKLTVKHNGEDLTFLYPAYGPDDYTTVGEQIEKDRLLKPTMAETVSLVHAAFNSDDKYSDEIKKIIKEGYFWAFTGNLYIPNKGVYIQDYPEIKDKKVFMEESDLVKKLEANDPNVRFVPFGYKEGTMSAWKLARNDFVKALAGKEGAKKLAKIAGKYKNKPRLRSFESVDEPLIRVSSVGSYWGLVDRRLDVVGGNYGYVLGGCTLGIQKNTKKEK